MAAELRSFVRSLGIPLANTARRQSRREEARERGVYHFAGGYFGRASGVTTGVGEAGRVVAAATRALKPSGGFIGASSGPRGRVWNVGSDVMKVLVGSYLSVLRIRVLAVTSGPASRWIRKPRLEVLLGWAELQVPPPSNQRHRCDVTRRRRPSGRPAGRQTAPHFLRRGRGGSVSSRKGGPAL